MKNALLASLVILSGSFLPFVASADNCPDANSVFEHATKEGVGALWKTGEKLNWYLDNFSNSNKPPETVSGKFTFMQANYENNQLTCYYQWPTEDGKTTNWLSVRLKTTQKLKLEWTGATCSNFEAQNCQFSLLEGASTAPAAAPTAPAAEPKK
ncbi:MAG: hypothetical protein JSR17_08945 [Proteobacteria bacterium]|nr:hypothetical protein [Pseudomonadota bacterium]